MPRMWSRPWWLPGRLKPFHRRGPSGIIPFTPSADFTEAKLHADYSAVARTFYQVTPSRGAFPLTGISPLLRPPSLGLPCPRRPGAWLHAEKSKGCRRCRASTIPNSTPPRVMACIPLMRGTLAGHSPVRNRSYPQPTTANRRTQVFVWIVVVCRDVLIYCECNQQLGVRFPLGAPRKSRLYVSHAPMNSRRVSTM